MSAKLNVVNNLNDFNDYKVAASDPATFQQQAQWGRKEITIAESEMPALMALRQKYKAE